MTMLPNERSYMIRGEDGEEYGPVDLTELRGWVQENRAGLGTEVRLSTPGEPWHTWHDYPELVALLAEVQGTSPDLVIPGLVLAGYPQRLAAFILDYFLICVLATPTVMIVASVWTHDWFLQTYATILQNSATNTPTTWMPDYPPEVKMMLNVVVTGMIMLYFTCFQAAHGKTPAKAVLRLRVVDQFGQKPRFTQMLLRTLVLLVSMMLFFIPFVYIFVNPQRRALHDLLAGTCVVESP